jgi:hypothetical protein
MAEVRTALDRPTSSRPIASPNPSRLATSTPRRLASSSPRLHPSSTPRRLPFVAPSSAQRPPRQAAGLLDVPVVASAVDPVGMAITPRRRLRLAGEAGADGGAARGDADASFYSRRTPSSGGGGGGGRGGGDLGVDLISWLMGPALRFEPGDPGPAASLAKPPAHPPASLLPTS